MQLKRLHLNQQGIAHIIMPLAAIAVIGGIGSYIFLNQSNANQLPAEGGSPGVTSQSIGSKYSGTISVSPAPQPGVVSTYKVTIKNRSNKTIAIGRHALADDIGPTTTSSGGRFFGGTESNYLPSIGTVSPKSTKVLKFKLKSPTEVKGAKIKGGIILKFMQIDSQGVRVLDENNQYHPLPAKAYQY